MNFKVFQIFKNKITLLFLIFFMTVVENFQKIIDQNF